jgi:hypothetical protein
VLGEAYTVEMDELYTFIEEKKQDLYPDLCRPETPLHSGLEGEHKTQWH